MRVKKFLHFSTLVSTLCRKGSSSPARKKGVSASLLCCALLLTMSEAAMARVRLENSPTSYSPSPTSIQVPQNASNGQVIYSYTTPTIQFRNIDDSPNQGPNNGTYIRFSSFSSGQFSCNGTTSVPGVKWRIRFNGSGSTMSSCSRGTRVARNSCHGDWCRASSSVTIELYKSGNISDGYIRFPSFIFMMKYWLGDDGRGFRFNTHQSVHITAPPPPRASIGDRVWFDTDKDGIQDSGETGVPNVKVNLKNAHGTVISSTVTNSNGIYRFRNLAPGTYAIGFDLSTLPSGYEVTRQDATRDDLDSDANSSNGMTVFTTLTAGENDLTWDMGISRIHVPAASIGDRVWFDDNGNGIQDPGEAGVPNIRVNLKNAHDTIISSTVTNANGKYLFSNVTPGVYSIGFDLSTLPSGYEVTLLGAGTASSGSDADPVTGMTAQTTLVDGENDLTWDMGISRIPPANATIGNRVWFDENGDGVQDTGESGVPHVTVNLKNESGTVIASTVTNRNGLYQFADLTPGVYSIDFDLSTIPAEYQVTLQDAALNDNQDSDADPTTGMTENTTLEAGEVDNSWDMGISPVPPANATIGNRVWFDENGNGIQDNGENGVPHVKVNLKDAHDNVIRTTKTDHDGIYSFTDVTPGTYSIGFVLSTIPEGYEVTQQDAGNNDEKDSDANPTTGMTILTTLEAGEVDNSWDMGIFQPSVEPASIGNRVWFDENGDGLQNASEPGVPNVKVNLKDENGDIIASTTTDSRGLYQFTDLVPGTYALGFDLSTFPEGYIVTLLDAGNDNIDNDADAFGMTAFTVLEPGEVDLSWDAGIVLEEVEPAKNSSIGNRVWFDTNGNGRQDGRSERKGVKGVTVNLKDANGDIIATTVTNRRGFYRFNNLAAGTYSIGFDLSTIPDGFEVTLQDAVRDGRDSDADPETGMTKSFELLVNQRNNRWDMGIRPESCHHCVHP